MKAIILAAGSGNRMMPLTKHNHKTLLKISNITIIDGIVNSLKENNIVEIIIATGYLNDKLKRHLNKNHSEINFQYIENKRFNETNNIFSLSLVFEQAEINDDIILIESDLIFNKNIIRKIIETKYKNVALVSPYKIGLDGTVVQVKQDQIINIYPPHLQDEKFNLSDKFKTLNIYKFSKEFCENDFKKILIYYANLIDDNCYYELILGVLIYLQKTKINSLIVDNSDWAEVDDPNDIASAEFQFQKEKRIELLENSFGGYWNYDILDFCFIRNMYFPTKSMLAELNNFLPNLLTNYGSKQSILNKKLSYVMQYNEDRIIALNGAGQIYPILKNIFYNKKTLLPSPTFGEYENIFKKFITYDDKVGFNLKEFEDKINLVDLIVIVNPNNPTGSILSTEYIFQLCINNPNKIFIVDESFIEFSNESSIIDLLEENVLKNILVIRSMSKSYGLPGIRLGLIYTSDISLHQYILNETPIWNLNSMAEFYMEIILKNKISLKDSFKKTKLDREKLIDQLNEIDLINKVYPSEANFILFEIENKDFKSIDFMNFLLNSFNIFLKDVSKKFNNIDYSYFRVAVRTEAENEKLILAISNFRSKS